MKRDSRPTRAARRAETRSAASARASAGSTRMRGGQRGGSARGAVATWVHAHPWIVLGAVLAVHVLLGLLTFMPQPHTGGDSAHYMTLARSLLEHHSYTDLYEPTQPPHTKYPPVFPLVLAAGMAIGLTTWVQLKLVMLGIGTAALALTFLWIRRRGRPLLALAVALLLGFSPGIIDQSHWLLSDVPFWCFTMLALWAYDRMRADDWTRFAIAVAATILAYFTRSAGLPLVLASIAWLVWRGRWRQLGAFIVLFAPLALLWWLRAQNTGGVAYTQEFWLIDPYNPELGRVGIADLLQRMGVNAMKYATIHIPILLGGRTATLLSVTSLAITGLAVAGWILRLRRAMVAELLMPLYIGLLLLWPAVWSGERFVLPIFPLLLYYAGIGLTRAMRRIAPRYVITAGAALTVCLLLVDVPVLNASIANGRACTNAYSRGEMYPCLYPAERSYFDAAIWSARSLPADAVVISRKPRLFYAISAGIRGTTYPMVRTTSTFFTLADSIHARYVIFDRLTSLADVYLAPVLLQRPQAFCLLNSFGEDGTTMFGILPGATRMPDQPVPESAQPSFAACDRSYFR